MNRFKIGLDVGEDEADPEQFLECATVAEAKGFDSLWFGDHFMPWVHTGGRSAFVWSIMASALERTRRINVGPLVTCPIGGRFHPAIIAQASATLDKMYPGRFMLGVGSGEAVNEARFFQDRPGGWPGWKERIERLAEAIVLMRSLWTREDYFTFEGRFFRMADVLLYTKPKTKIPIYFASVGAKSAAYAGKFGDHLITGVSPDKCRDIIFPRFEEAFSAEGKDPREAEKMVHIHFMIGDHEQGIKKLRPAILVKGAFEETDPRRVERASLTVDEGLIRENWQLCPTVDDLVEVVQRYLKVGANHIVFLTGPHPDQIELIGDRVLPQLR